MIKNSDLIKIANFTFPWTRLVKVTMGDLIIWALINSYKAKILVTKPLKFLIEHSFIITWSLCWPMLARAQLCIGWHVQTFDQYSCWKLLNTDIYFMPKLRTFTL